MIEKEKKMMQCKCMSMVVRDGTKSINTFFFNVSWDLVRLICNRVTNCTKRKLIIIKKLERKFRIDSVCVSGGSNRKFMIIINQK